MFPASRAVDCKCPREESSRPWAGPANLTCRSHTRGCLVLLHFPDCRSAALRSAASLDPLAPPATRPAPAVSSATVSVSATLRHLSACMRVARTDTRDLTVRTLRLPSAPPTDLPPSPPNVPGRLQPALPVQLRTLADDARVDLRAHSTRHK